MHEKDGQTGGVDVETLCQHTGWAVFTGCEGEDVHFVAYFADYDRAQAYIDMCVKLDSESDYKMMDGDASVVPAVIDPEDGTIMWANTGALEQGAKVLTDRFHIEPYDAARFTKEARKAVAPTAPKVVPAQIGANGVCGYPLGERRPCALPFGHRGPHQVATGL